MWSLDYYYCINYSLILLLYKWTFSLFRHSLSILSISLTSLILLSISLLLYLLCRRAVERDLLFEENHCTKLRTLRACALILPAVLEETEILRTNGKSSRHLKRDGVCCTPDPTEGKALRFLALISLLCRCVFAKETQSQMLDCCSNA